MEVAWKKKRRKKRKWIVPREARKKQNTLKAEQEREYTKSGTRVRAVSQVSLSSLRAVECATTRSGPPRPSLSSRFFFHREGVRRKWRTLFSRGIIAHSFQGDTLFFWKESTILRKIVEMRKTRDSSMKILKKLLIENEEREENGGKKQYFEE